MADLKENLGKLSEAIPRLPGKVATVQKSAEALEQTATAMLAQFEKKKAEVDNLATQVREALTDLEGEGTDQEGALRNVTEAVETALEETIKALQTGRDEVIAAVDDTGEAYGALEGQVKAAASRTETAHQDADQALTEVKTGLETGQSELETSTTAATDAVEAVGQELETGNTEVGEAMTTLKNKMTELLDETRTRLGQTESLLQSASAAAEGGVGEAVTGLEGDKDELFQALSTRVQNELRQTLDTALQKVVESLGRLSGTVSTAKDGIQADREGVESQFEETRGRIPPLQGGVESVKQAATEVGIAFQ